MMVLACAQNHKLVSILHDRLCGSEAFPLAPDHREKLVAIARAGRSNLIFMSDMLWLCDLRRCGVPAVPSASRWPGWPIRISRSARAWISISFFRIRISDEQWSCFNCTGTDRYSAQPRRGRAIAVPLPGSTLLRRAQDTPPWSFTRNERSATFHARSISRR